MFVQFQIKPLDTARASVWRSEIAKRLSVMPNKSGSKSSLTGLSDGEPTRMRVMFANLLHASIECLVMEPRQLRQSARKVKCITPFTNCKNHACFVLLWMLSYCFKTDEGNEECLKKTWYSKTVKLWVLFKHAALKLVCLARGTRHLENRVTGAQPWHWFLVR